MINGTYTEALEIEKIISVLKKYPKERIAQICEEAVKEVDNLLNEKNENKHQEGDSGVPSGSGTDINPAINVGDSLPK
jgi:hypothetical protein